MSTKWAVECPAHRWSAGGSLDLEADEESRAHSRANSVSLWSAIGSAGPASGPAHALHHAGSWERQGDGDPSSPFGIHLLVWGYHSGPVSHLILGFRDPSQAQHGSHCVLVK